MHVRKLHSWNVTPREAREIQDRLRGEVACSWDDRPVRTLAGTDMSFPSKAEVLAAVVVVTYPHMKVVETRVRGGPCTFPYVPGLLAFREAPMLIEALSSLTTEPDVILCDGQGLAHPKGMGLACHVGLLADAPTIGCAKSRLYGSFEEPGAARGSSSDLLGRNGEVIGCVLRTRARVSPVYVSVGHKIDIETAVKLILGCSPKYRIPEPLRMAHKLAAGERVG
jgi:deoxyribonuclease V